MKVKPQKTDTYSAEGDASSEDIARRLKLDKGLGFLVRLLDTRVNVLYERLTAQNDITPRQFGVLLTLYQQGTLTLRRHGGDADIDLNSSDPRPRGAVLRQPAFRDVKSGQDLDTRDDGLRRRIAWKRHGAEDPVNPHSHDKRGPEWLNVDVARSQFHGALKQIVDGPDHWSPA